MKTRATLRKTLLPFLCVLTFALPAEAGQAAGNAASAWGPGPFGARPVAAPAPSSPAEDPARDLGALGPVDLDAALAEAFHADAALRSA